MNKDVEEWRRLWESKVIDYHRIKSVGNSLANAIATGYCGECEVHKQIISELKEENRRLRKAMYGDVEKKQRLEAEESVDVE